VPDGIAAMKAKREAARAARTPPAPHHPREQVASDSASGEAGFSASENASEQAGGNAVAITSAPERANPAGQASRKAGGKAGGKARKGGGAPRRRGRPRGPERITLSVRILPELDARLTAECDAAGTGPQEVVEAALTAWLARRERQRAE
jgi:hypothetical protein